MAQGARESNVGEYGVESIRLDGIRIENLPLGRGEIAKRQIPLALDVERQGRIQAVIARYPKGDKAYVSGRMREAQANIEQFKRKIAEFKGDISRYRIHIKECDGLRSHDEVNAEIKEIQQLDLTVAEKTQLIKKAKMHMAPWDVDGLERQIVQFEDSIERFQDAIEQEHRSIAELNRLSALISMRDLELQNLGVSVAK